MKGKKEMRRREEKTSSTSPSHVINIGQDERGDKDGEECQQVCCISHKYNVLLLSIHINNFFLLLNCTCIILILILTSFYMYCILMILTSFTYGNYYYTILTCFRKYSKYIIPFPCICIIFLDLL